MAQAKVNGKYIIIPLSQGRHGERIIEFSPSSLVEIFRFDEMIRATQRHNPGYKIVLCTGPDLYTQMKGIFLTGCHLIMSQCFNFEETVGAFMFFEHAMRGATIAGDELTMPCCWMALYRAKCLGWIDFGDIFDTGIEEDNRIFLEEYIHYAR
jgi:hypothetical protein